MFLTTCTQKKTVSFIIFRHTSSPSSSHCRLHIGPSDLSEGLSFILFARILGNLLQVSSPLGPLLHFDQAGQQTDQQKEDQQAHQGNDGHIQGLQLVGCMEIRREREEKDGSGRVNISTDPLLIQSNTEDKRKGLFFLSEPHNNDYCFNTTL